MFFSNSDPSFIVIFFVKLEAYRGLILVKTVCSGHIRFYRYGLKRYDQSDCTVLQIAIGNFGPVFQMRISRE